MKKSTTKTYTLEPDDTRRAIAEYINLHLCGEDSVNEDIITIEFEFLGERGGRKKFPIITVKEFS